MGAVLSEIDALPSATLLQPPLIGRATELDQLATALEARRLVTLAGLAGIGKSRLAAEFVSRSRAGDVR